MIKCTVEVGPLVMGEEGRPVSGRLHRGGDDGVCSGLAEEGLHVQRHRPGCRYTHWNEECGNNIHLVAWSGGLQGLSKEF